MKRVRRLLLASAIVLLLVALGFVFGVFGGRGPAPTGRVVTASGAPPPAGTEVVALGGRGRPTTTTDSSGAFRFDPVPEGTVAFEARMGAVIAKARAGATPVRIRLPARVELRGRIVGPSALLPVVGAVVRCGEAKAVSGDRGDFVLQGVRVTGGGLPSIVVIADGYRRLVLHPGKGLELDDLFLKLRR